MIVQERHDPVGIGEVPPRGPRSPLRPRGERQPSGAVHRHAGERRRLHQLPSRDPGPDGIGSASAHGRCHLHLRPGASGDERGGVGERADGGAPPRPLGELAGRGSLRTIEPAGRSIARRSSGVASPSAWPSTSTPSDVGEQEQEVCAQPFREQRCGQVLVDNGFDAGEGRRPRGRRARRRRPRRSRARQSGPGSRSPAARRGRAAVASRRRGAARCHRGASPSRARPRAVARVQLVDLADRLRGVEQPRVIGRNDRLGEDRRHRAAGARSSAPAAARSRSRPRSRHQGHRRAWARGVVEVECSASSPI